MNQSSFDRCRIDNVDLYTDLIMLYDLVELAPLPGEPQTVQHPCIETIMREHGGKDGTTGWGVLIRIAFPAAEATFGALWLPGQDPSGGPPAATKFEDYKVLTNCGCQAERARGVRPK
jgi:hypothetical protein